MTAIDDRARNGFANAERYDSYRPSYPPEAIAYIRRAAGLTPESTVVDLAAGTGLMTRLLAPAGRLIAIEPIPEMRAVLEAQVPEAEVLNGTAEQMPLSSSVADAVVTAQAFHWFANARAVAEIARVLKPGGTLAIVWNGRDPDCVLLQRVKAITGPFRGDSPDHETIPWRDVFEAADSPLRLAGHETFAWEERIPLERLKGRVSSVSFIALLDPEARAGVMRQLEELAGSPSDDAPVVLQYLTEVFLAKRRPER